MMKTIQIILLMVFIFYSSCCPENKNNDVEEWKNEIMETEKEFAELAQQEGIANAFLEFSANDAVLMRNNRLIIGKTELSESFKNVETDPEKVSLSWKPDFVDVSASGDLGYTYGKYFYSQTDSAGITKKDSGIFHTVWKRQADGEWRFVWD